MVQKKYWSLNARMVKYEIVLLIFMPAFVFAQDTFDPPQVPEEILTHASRSHKTLTRKYQH
jgi:hypothetical protein